MPSDLPLRTLPRRFRLVILDVVAFARMRHELRPRTPDRVLASDVEHVLLNWRKRFQLPMCARYSAEVRELFAAEPPLAMFLPPWTLELALRPDDGPD